MNPRPVQNLPLLQLPLELRLAIYDYLLLQWDRFLSQPSQHPLYVLLFVSRALRIEISDLIYRKPFLRFSSPDQYTSFFNISPPNFQFITSLTISVPADKTETLEPVFWKLCLANAKLRKFAIYLTTPDGRFAPKERVVTAYMLPRRLCVSPGGKRRVALQTGLRFGAYYIVLDDSKENYIYEDEIHEPLAVEASKSCNASLGKMKDLRSISVFGQPAGERGLELELALLKGLWEDERGCQKRSEGDGLRKYASRAKQDTWWWFEGRIEGEEEEENQY
jgi:hypothetical protein